MNDVYAFLKKCNIYYLATMDGNQPRVRPFGTVDWFEDKIYFQTDRRKDVSRQMAVNPKVEICAFDGSQWLRISATAVDDDRFEPKKHLLDAYPNLPETVLAEDHNTQVLYLKDATATLFSFTDKPVTIKF